MAENVAESLNKGMRVVVSGRLRSRSYETREGDKRTVFEVEVDEIGPSLRYATAKVTRTSSSSGGGSSWQPASSNNGGGNQGGWGGNSSDNYQAANDPWPAAQSDEPPF